MPNECPVLPVKETRKLLFIPREYMVRNIDKAKFKTRVHVDFTFECRYNGLFVLQTRP